MFDYDVFLSFASPDIELVRPVWQRLASSGLRVFCSDKSLRAAAGQNFVSVIQEALGNSKDFILLWSAHAASSSWVEEEYQAFYSQCYMHDKKTRRLLVLHGAPANPHPLPTFLRQLQSVQSIDHLVESLGGTDIAALKRRNDELEDLVRNLQLEVAELRQRAVSSPTHPELSSAKPLSVESSLSRQQETGLALQVVDRTAARHVLRDVHIKYSSGFGPSDEKSGIRVRRGSLEALLKWADIRAVDVAELQLKPLPQNLWVISIES
jgi:hypothetical protein